MELTADLSALAPSVRGGIVRKLAHADRARYEVGLVEQIRMKQLHDAMVTAGSFNEVGPATMILSQDQYQRAMQTYGQYCFLDPDFSPWLLKKNDDMRVKSAGTRIQIGWSRPCIEFGGRGAGGGGERRAA